jgi:hypothetical protein
MAGGGVVVEDALARGFVAGRSVAIWLEQSSRLGAAYFRVRSSTNKGKVKDEILLAKTPL